MVDVANVAVAEGLLEGAVHRVLAQPHGDDLALGLAGEDLELVRSGLCKENKENKIVKMNIDQNQINIQGDPSG